VSVAPEDGGRIMRAAGPLSRSLRAQYLERLDEALRGRDSVGDGELSRLAHGIARELSSESRQQQRTGPSHSLSIANARRDAERRLVPKA
jgi:hypothetical protein